jgi:hypothetical protein
MNKHAFLFGVVCVCAGCGGSDYSPPAPDSAPAPTPSPSPSPAPGPAAVAAPAPAEVQGVFAGTSNSGFDVVMVQLDDGSVFGIEGHTVNSVFTSSGLLRAAGNYAKGVFVQVQPANLYPYYGGAEPGSLSGSYTSGGAFNWSFATSFGTTQWITTKLPSQTYDYDHAATLVDLSGSWSGRAFTEEGSTTLVVSSSGEMSGVNMYGCRFSGMAMPRPGGKNVFNISIAFANAPSVCDNPGDTATGIGVILQVSDTVRQFVFGVSVDRGSEGLVWPGVR